MTSDLQQQITQLQQNQYKIVKLIGDLVEAQGDHSQYIRQIFEDFYEDVEEKKEFYEGGPFEETFKRHFGTTPPAGGR